MFACNGLDHVCFFATLSARPRVYVLEAFKLELCFGLGWRYLLPNGMVGVDLGIGHSNADRALALRPLIVMIDTISLEFHQYLFHAAR